MLKYFVSADTFLTYLVFTFYCRTLVLMPMPTVLQPLCGSCWLVVQSHRNFITNQSLFALPNKQRYCSYHQAMCLHLVTQVTLSCFVCTLLTFLQIQDLLNGLYTNMRAFIFAIVNTPETMSWFTGSAEIKYLKLKLWKSISHECLQPGIKVSHLSLLPTVVLLEAELMPAIWGGKVKAVCVATSQLLSSSVQWPLIVVGAQ